MSFIEPVVSRRWKRLTAVGRVKRSAKRPWFVKASPEAGADVAAGAASEVALE
jgi:hypothetical protein